MSLSLPSVCNSHGRQWQRIKALAPFITAMRIESESVRRELIPDNERRSRIKQMATGFGIDSGTPHKCPDYRYSCWKTPRNRFQSSAPFSQVSGEYFRPASKNAFKNIRKPGSHVLQQFKLLTDCHAVQRRASGLCGLTVVAGVPEQAQPAN
jgi:hypothetical protein